MTSPSGRENDDQKKKKFNPSLRDSKENHWGYTTMAKDILLKNQYKLASELALVYFKLFQLTTHH